MSVSGIQPAPVTAAPDGSAQLRADAVLEIGFLLRKVLEARAQYSLEHPNARTALIKLNERLLSILTSAQTLNFEVTPTQLLVGTFPLHRNATEPDALAQSLFGDGARRIVMSRGLTVSQLTAFLDIAGRRRSADSDQSVMTEFWEAELTNIQFVVATTFAEDGNESLEVDAPGAQKNQREQIASVMNVFTNPDLSAAFDGDNVPTMIALSNAELEVLSSSNLTGIEGSSLREHDAAGRDALLTVDSEALRTLRNRLSQPRADSTERLLASLFDAAVAAPDDLKPKVIESLLRLFESLLKTNKLEPCARAIEYQVQAARVSQAIAAQKLPVLNQLRLALIASPLIDTLIAALDDPGLAPHAIPLLRIFGTVALDKVFDTLGHFKTEHGKHNASKVLAVLNPKPDQLATRAKTATPEVAREIVLLCNKHPVSIVGPMLGAMMQSHDAAIRRVVVKTIERSVALGMSALLRRMIGDPDREVRMAVVKLLAYAEDQASVDLMSRTLTRTSTDVNERREIYRALGEIGGVPAGDALTAEFARITDVEARIALVANFGRAWSPKAAQAIGEMAGKLLGSPKLRQACKAAVVKAEAEAAATPGAPAK